MTAQLVQELPIMLSNALDTNADNVIIVSITKTTIPSIKKRLDSASINNNGIIVSFAIPKTDVNELQMLVTNTSSPLYSTKYGQLPTFIDQNYPVTGNSGKNKLKKYAPTWHIRKKNMANQLYYSI